ncbi:MAG TPA: rhodanese-like domain-containing protein [Anaerolineales bacterium]|nr:rhodanese-like domain-containing protein [Anaerolineales bacterium]
MKRFVLVLLAAILLASCQSKPVTGETVSVDGKSYRNITAAELHTLLKNKDFILINVHIPFAGNLANTDLSISYDQIEQNVSQLPADKNTKIVLYCRSGHMSGIAAEKLLSLGYTNIWNLKGGMAQWEADGFEIQN